MGPDRAFKGRFLQEDLMPFIQAMQYELSVCGVFFLLHSNTYLEAIVSVKVGEYCSNLFME